MKISLIIFFVLIVQVSTSFLDVFQGAMHSVQNSFGKLLNDVVTDVKETVDCTILAIEHVFSLSADATALYNEKCGNGSNTTVTNQPKENNAPTLEISFLNNPDYLNKLLPDDIDKRINDTLMRIFHGYNPHDKLANVERELAEETKRLAGISDLVKQELEKLSAEIHIDLTRQHSNDSKPSVDNILQELRLLEAVEQNIGNSSEANEIHKVVENVLLKLNEIEASEVSENSKVDKILKDLENYSNGTYKDLRKRLQDWKNEEDRHMNLIKKKIEEHKAKPEHSTYTEKNKLNNILQYQPNSFINHTSSNSSAEIINKSTQTPQPDVTYKSSKMISSNLDALNATTSTISTTLAIAGSMAKKSSASELAHIIPLTSDQPVTLTSSTKPKIELSSKRNILSASNTTNSRAALNVTSSYGSATSLPNITTSTVFTTLATVGSLAKNSSISELVHITHLTSAKPVATTNKTPIIKQTTETSTTDFKTTLNATPSYGSTTSSADINILLTFSPTAAIVESLRKNSSGNRLADITPLTSDKSVALISTTTPKIEVRTKGNILKNYSITDASVHSLRSLSHSELLVNRSTTPPLSSSVSVSLTPKMSPPQLKTTVKTYELSTKFNDSEKSKKNNMFIIRKPTESNILLLKSPITVKSTIETAEQIITPIGRHKLSTTTQIDDEVNTTPVSITTSSYVNKQKSSITETILNTDSSTIINSIANTLNQDLQPDYKTLTTIAPSTPEQMTIVDENHSTTSATTDVTSEIPTVIPTTQRYHANDNNFGSTVATTQSTIEFTPSQLTLKLSTHHTITTPSLDAFLKYVDRIVTSTPISTTKSKEIPASHAHEEMQDPWLTHSQNVLNRATPEIINSNSILPLNDKFATRPYDHSANHLNKDIPSLPRFKPPNTVYNDPSLFARNGRFMNEEKLLPARDGNKPVPDSHISLPSRSSLNKGNIPFPYAGINNNNAFLKRKVPRSSLLMPTHTGHAEIPAPVMNNKGSFDMLNHKSDTHKGTKPKLDNFDNPDSFFHMPSKDAEHERALNVARKLIEDSQKAHRVMQRLLGRNKKGKNAYSLPSSLKFGK